MIDTYKIIIDIVEVLVIPAVIWVMNNNRTLKKSIVDIEKDLLQNYMRKTDCKERSAVQEKGYREEHKQIRDLLEKQASVLEKVCDRLQALEVKMGILTACLEGNGATV